MPIPSGSAPRPRADTATMPPKRIRASPLPTPSPACKRARVARGARSLSATSPATPRWTQLALDVGQRDVSATKCKVCGMVYAPGADDEAHTSFHRAAERRKALKFTPSAARSVGPPARVSRSGAALYVIDADLPIAVAAHRAAAEALLFHADNNAHRPAKAVIAVANSLVVGFLAFERVDEAEVCAVRSSDGSAVRVGKTRVRRALCGVRILWVASHARRKGAAAAMLDVARKNAAYAHCFVRQAVAFTPPTIAGARFAASYAPQNVRLRAKYGSQHTDDRVAAYILVYKPPRNEVTDSGEVMSSRSNAEKVVVANHSETTSSRVGTAEKTRDQQDVET